MPRPTPILSPLATLVRPRQNVQRLAAWAAMLAGLASPCVAQFRADFNPGEPLVRVDAGTGGGWSWYSGDGEATIEMQPADGYARIVVDAREDRYNTWWAFIRSRVDQALSPAELATGGRALRIEARVRVSHAPRRINLYLQTPGPGSYEKLREFDIPVAGVWHQVSWTTPALPPLVGEPIFAQLAMMDWGQERFTTDIDYFQVSIVDPATIGPDEGRPQRYHPPLPPSSALPEAVVVAADAVIDANHPDMALDAWGVPGAPGEEKRLLDVSSSQTVLLRWNLEEYAGRTVRDTAVLELTTHHLSRWLSDHEELGRLRVVEILENAPNWSESEVTWQSFTGGAPLTSVTNAQTMIDVLINPAPGALNRIAVPAVVMQRLLDGRSRGLALRALGPVHAVLRAREHAPVGEAPTLRFSTEAR